MKILNSIQSYNNMQLSALRDECVALIDKILRADTLQEVQKYCDAGIKALENQAWAKPAIADFLELVSRELKLFSPMDENPKQWNNINIAKIHIIKTRRQMGGRLY